MNALESCIKNNQNPLDYPITLEELNGKLKSLKCNKSCGPDNIKNEMLKISSPELQIALLKLFNLTLSSGVFPEVWNTGLISPIFKSGDKTDPNNYRGICVTSNLAKVFCSIINSRISSFLEQHNVISKSQIGFLPKHRTTDHIHTLHTLINEHVHLKKEGKIFACFIDFKKAFDSIWHNGLFYKIIQSGIGGKIYDLIKNMYNQNKCAVKIGQQRTDYFSQERGVRQGCCLSPTLFNIYINELADLLDQSDSPGLELLHTEVKYLLYADDLIILSKTPEGLQNNLNILTKYCHDWNLEVNIPKTKIMIFQKKTRNLEHKHIFTLNNTTLQHALQYNYLGLVLTPTGNFNLAIKALLVKARRALHAIRTKLFKIDIPIRIWTKIFDSVILPIALYGSEIWGPTSNYSHKDWHKHPLEALHVEFCRSILHVHRNTPNNACRAELGRLPLNLVIKKRVLKFWIHLNSSSEDSLHFKAVKTQLMSAQKSNLCVMVSDLTNKAFNITNPEKPGRIKEIMNEEKETYIQHWKKQTKDQSRLQCYLKLNREYRLADYLVSVRNITHRHLLTKYRLSDHQLAIERGRHKKTWLPKEERICIECRSGSVETEEHFLLHCDKYTSLRDALYSQIQQIIPEFQSLQEHEKLRILLAEGPASSLVALHIYKCHKLRSKEWTSALVVPVMYI